VIACARAFARSVVLGDTTYDAWLGGDEQPWAEASYQRRSP